MKITVTQEHIDEAWVDRARVSCVNCPVALAIMNKGYSRVAVLNTGYINIDQFTVPMPSEVLSFIHYFDACRFGRTESKDGFRPFSFDLDIPELMTEAIC